MRLVWGPMALEDREALLEHIAQCNPQAAIEVDGAIEAKAEQIRQRLLLDRIGRVPDTCEAVVRPNDILVYRVEDDGDDGMIVMLRVPHAAQQWPLGV